MKSLVKGIPGSCISLLLVYSRFSGDYLLHSSVVPCVLKGKICEAVTLRSSWCFACAIISSFLSNFLDDNDDDTGWEWREPGKISSSWTVVGRRHRWKPRSWASGDGTSRTFTAYLSPSMCRRGLFPVTNYMGNALFFRFPPPTRTFLRVLESLISDWIESWHECQRSIYIFFQVCAE